MSARTGATGDVELLRIDLARPIDLFETPPIVLGGTGRSFRSGVDQCLAQLQDHRTPGPVHLEIALPAAEVTPETEALLTTTLRAWCAERAHANTQRRDATRRAGLEALRVGTPVTILGLVITAVAVHTGDSEEDPVRAVVDILGWVLAWLGLWYPFDKLLFYPRDDVQENGALQLLQDAPVTVVALPPDSA